MPDRPTPRLNIVETAAIPKRVAPPLLACDMLFRINFRSMQGEE